MAIQSLAFSIFLFMFVTYIFLVFFTKELQNNRKKEIPLDEQEVASQVEEEVTLTSQVNEDIVSQETEAVTDQELLTKETNSTNLEDVRNVGNLKFKIRRFSIQKKGLSEAECEDKNAVSSQDLSNLQIAIADGATESLFSDIWADILVNNYVNKGADLLNSSTLESVSQKFVYTASQKVLKMPETRQWFMYEKLERGTHATLAAVEFSSTLETVQILTVGDSCVFWCYGNADEINMLPELTAEEFGSFPDSICHLPKTWQSLEQKVLKKEITFQNNLQMVLCTDALACWLVKELETKSSIWEELLQISDYSFFTDFIETLREKNSIRNDDVTLVLINVLPFNV